MIYHRLVAGEFGGEPADPGNAYERGALALDGLVVGDRVPDRFALPPDVAEAFQRAADAYERYVDAVEDFDSLPQASYWRRWHALRSALPEAPHAVIRRLLALLSEVPTDRLAAVGATQPNGAPA